MNSMDIIKESLQENLDIEPETVTSESTLDSLDIDSLDMTELICDIEEKCDIEFGELEGVQTIGQLAERIDSLR